MTIQLNNDAIAHYFADYWKTKLPNVAEYLQDEFGFSLDPAWHFKRLFICEMADATVSKGNIGDMYARKWVLINGILESVALDFAYKEMYELDPSENVYASPSFLYARDADAVLWSERYGPSLKHRRRGQILAAGQSFRMEWKTLWKT